MVLGRDKIEVRGARITSPLSALALDASLSDLRNPRGSAHLNGHIALAELKRAGGLPLNSSASNPSAVDLDANATVVGSSIQVTNLRVTLGHSNLEASGALDRGLNFTSRLSLDELTRISKAAAHATGFVAVNGIAKLGAQNNLEINHLQIAAVGAEFSGDVSLQNFARYQLRGNLRHLDVKDAIRAAGVQPLPYDGVISGSLSAEGNFKAPFLRQLTARAQLSISPGSRGVPVSGHLNAAYTGANDSLSIQHSLLTLPHSRLTIDGSPGKQLNVALTTTNLDDLLASVAPSPRPKVALNGGQASFDGSVSGPLTAPRITGHLTATRITFADRQFDNLVADATVSKSNAVVQSGSLSRAAMLTHFSGSIGLRDWQPLPSSALSASASIQNGDLADLLALTGEPSAGYSGQLSANLNINGTLGDPSGSATVTVNAGSIEGQPFDRAQAQVNLADQLVTVPSLPFKPAQHASISRPSINIRATASPPAVCVPMFKAPRSICRSYGSSKTTAPHLRNRAVERPRHGRCL